MNKQTKEEQQDARIMISIINAGGDERMLTAEVQRRMQNPEAAIVSAMKADPYFAACFRATHAPRPQTFREKHGAAAADAAVERYLKTGR